MALALVHLHNHTEFSLLDGASKIEDLAQRAAELEMKALGISDHGNMFGIPKFVIACKKYNLQPIIGCEFYIVKNDHTIFDDKKNPRYHQILFAKNEEGYRNLIKLSSLAYTEGFYGKPRISRDLLAKYHSGIVATTCCLASEINRTIINRGAEEAEKIFRWYLDLFGADYYIEIQRHGPNREQDICNQTVIEWGRRYGVKILATNDVHYTNAQDSEAHDLLLALATGQDYTRPNMRTFRFLDDNGNLDGSFYLKTPEEMTLLFQDIPEAIENTVEVAEKCTFKLNLNADLILPVFKVPEPPYLNGKPLYEPSAIGYLTYLTWEGAKKRYGVITLEIEERINYELKIMQQMGFVDYFLIVQEFTNEARRRGVFVGPGRGSAAGSVVAYCIGIIDIDPLKYQLLFERFLNPERVSPPDIDMDFDDEGREEVINFVVEKYGRECVAQIITYGTMGAKTAIKDVGRVLGVPLAEVNRISKLIPEKPGMDFEKALTPEENPDHYQELRTVFESPDTRIQKMMAFAKTLEGSARHTGIHAAGVIIAPGPVMEYVPVSINNTRERIIVTQFDGPSAEKCGMLKMDFLGLKTLSILKTALRYIEQSRGIKINIDAIPLDDPKTFELYQAGETIATFQFESDGMRKYLKQLKPTTIEDLIAMNALYRPGPMDYIPSFIARKHGLEPIIYVHPLLEPILKNTYGIMVYQEQIMQCAQVVAGYTLGGADLLRRAMGKKKADEMAKERTKFIEGAFKTNQVPETVAGEIFDIMEKFAGYGFNKSHAAAYSLLAYRTAYLKANFPSEYMAAVLTHNTDNIEKITFFITECRRMGIEVLPPDINESELHFSVGKIHP
jgi:DNA polymerase-3 subunit alpha